jgi:hypothetical protein
MMVTRGSFPTALALSVLVGSLVLGSSLALRAQGDPLVGTWKLNVAKSKYQPGPPPMSEMRVYEPFGGAGSGVKATFNRVDAMGKKITVTYSAMYDGKDYKYSGPDGDTIALTREGANTVDATLKRDGKVSQTTKGVISADGKTRTLTFAGTDAKGQKISGTTVYEKQ